MFVDLVDDTKHPNHENTNSNVSLYMYVLTITEDTRI